MSLNVRSHVGKTSPVGPIYTTPLHVVHRNAIDEDSDILTLETTHRDFGITITTSFTRHIDTRSRFEHLWEIGGSHFFFDHHCTECGQSDWRFARYGTSGHHGVLQAHCGLVHGHKTEVAIACDLTTVEVLGFITYAGELEILLRALGSFEAKLTIGIGDCCRFSSLHHNGHARKRLVVLTVDHCALDYSRLCHGTHGGSYGYNGGE